MPQWVRWLWITLGVVSLLALATNLLGNVLAANLRNVAGYLTATCVGNIAIIAGALVLGLPIPPRAPACWCWRSSTNGPVIGRQGSIDAK